MAKNLASIGTALFLTLAATPVSAASLQVSPVSLEIAAPNSAAIVTLNNPSAKPLKAQMRVFRWSIVNGEEHLEPATDVVASPPIATLQPHTDYTVRVVKLSKQPVAVEETYRLMVDEIPDPSGRVSGTIAMAFRYSIPVFFMPEGPQKADLTWSVSRRGGKVFISAVNSGNRRVRIADLAAADGKGKSVSVAKGLAGYVLARSSKSWVAPRGFQTVSSPLLITAQGDIGPINAQAIPEAAR